MKKSAFTLFILIIICSSLHAQPPGGVRGGRGDRPGGMPPRGQSNNRPDRGEILLENLPQIPNITLEQREKLGSILKKEHSETTKELEKKKKIQMSFEKDKELSQKQIDKKLKEMDKIDDKIHKIRDKSNDKIKKILEKDQYEVFISKREEVKFRDHRHMQHHHREGGYPNPLRSRNRIPDFDEMNGEI